MVIRSRAAVLAIALAAARAAALPAQGGTSSGTLLDVPATPRALALQGAYTSVVRDDDEGSLFVNPAGMAAVHHLALGISTERGLYGVRLSTGAIVLRVGRFFDVGVGVMYQDLGGDSVVAPDALNEFGTTNGERISAWNGLAVGALAYRRGMLSVGGSVKVLHEVIAGGAANYRSSAVAGDLGFAVAVFDIFSFGAVLQNIGSGAHATNGAAAPLPRTGRIGVTLNFIDPEGTARLMATTDWVKPPGGNSYWAFGFEGGVVHNKVGVLGRLGISTGRADTDRSGLSLGAGLVVRTLRLDYAWQPYGALAGSQQRLGVRWIP